MAKTKSNAVRLYRIKLICKPFYRFAGWLFTFLIKQFKVQRDALSEAQSEVMLLDRKYRAIPKHKGVVGADAIGVTRDSFTDGVTLVKVHGKTHIFELN